MSSSVYQQARPAALVFLFALQAFCVLTLIGDVALDAAEATGALPTNEAADAPDSPVSEWLEALIVAALTFGFCFSGVEIWRMWRRQRRLEDQLRAASGAFQEVLDAHFERWKLTSAERDVALLALKGLSIAEIAAVRQSRDGTIKPQCSAIYRKAGVSGRPQLISLFIEELLGDGLSAETSIGASARASAAQG